MSDSESDTEADSSEISSSGSESEHEEVPFGQLIQQRQTGHLDGSHFRGAKAVKGLRKPPKLNQEVSKASNTARQDTEITGRDSRKKFRRENKNRPTEQSSKRPVPRLQKFGEGQSKRAMDPRFDDLTGRFKDETFKKRYSFLYDEQLPEEKSQLKKQMKATKSMARKQELQANLTRVEQQIRAELAQRKQRSAEKEAKAKEREAVKGGKKPFFLKKSEKKRQDLIRKYHELKASGRLEKAMAKKRRKNAAKDHRYVPETR